MSRRKQKRVTLKDLAKAADVSLASASYAVNNTGSLGAERRAEILRVAEEMGYRQNQLARAARTGRTGTIGFLVPDMNNPFFPSLAQSIFQRARAHGYSVFLADTEGDFERENNSFNVFVDRGVDGIVWFPINDESNVGELSEDVPTVVIDRNLTGLLCIQGDYEQGGHHAIQHLHNLGHRNIGIISGPMDVKSMRDRCASVRDEIKRLGEVAFEVTNAFSTDLDPATAEALKNTSATAVFVGSDLIAIGVLSYARKVGLRIPEDLSVVGFDDIAWASFSSPTLTTVELPVDIMGHEAVDSLIKQINGEELGAKRVVFETTLIVRDSTGSR